MEKLRNVGHTLQKLTDVVEKDEFLQNQSVAVVKNRILKMREFYEKVCDPLEEHLDSDGGEGAKLAKDIVAL